jgi:hypothetical protein
MTNTFDPEKFVPRCENFAAWHLAKFLCVSAQHVRNLIEEGCITVPKEELARIKRKEKPWTNISVPRGSVVDFIRDRTFPSFPKVRERGVAR